MATPNLFAFACIWKNGGRPKPAVSSKGNGAYKDIFKVLLAEMTIHRDESQFSRVREVIHRNG